MQQDTKQAEGMGKLGTRVPSQEGGRRKESEGPWPVACQPHHAQHFSEVWPAGSQAWVPGKEGRRQNHT